MKKILFIILLSIFTGTTYAQQIPALSIDEIIHHTSSKDTLYIINFWASWCGPCVGELSEFNSLYTHYLHAPVKVVMVSLDFQEDYRNGKLARFLERKKMIPEVVWLSDTDPNVFIPKIDNTWQGSIPATVIVHPGKGFKKFIEGSVTARQISKIVDKVITE